MKADIVTLRYGNTYTFLVKGLSGNSSRCIISLHRTERFCPTFHALLYRIPDCLRQDNFHRLFMSWKRKNKSAAVPVAERSVKMLGILRLE